MRVLHLDTGAVWRGGQRQVLHLHRGLWERGVDSLLVCSEGGELFRRARDAGLPVVGEPLRGEWDLPSAWRVARLLRTWDADLLHAHSSHAHALGLVAARVAGVPTMVVTRRVDFPPGRHVFNVLKYRNSILYYVVVSEAIREVLLASGVAPERIRVVHSGVEVPCAGLADARAVREEWGVGAEDLLIGNIAHLADHKGQRYLVEAVPAILRARPDAWVAVVGDGELAGTLRSRARSLGVANRVLFPGFREDVEAVMASLDVFVMPSHTEGLGTAVLDALAAGRPVVATRAGGIPEMIEHGVHGILVSPREPAALAEAIVRLAGSPDLCRRLAAAGQERVREHFGVGQMVEGNLEVYRDLTR